jgi:CDP-glycerol glycerophosphotransferase (TagB/SpsB family)
VFKPVLEELTRRKIPCTYYSSGEDDPGLSFPSDLIRREFIGEGNAAYRFLNFLEADICLMTTPGLDVFQLKRSPGVKHYVHILHMVTDSTTYRLFSLDYYDSVFLTGEYQKKAIRKLEEKRRTKRKDLAVVGCTYLDVLAELAAVLPAKDVNEKKSKTVLVAPSWGTNGILKRYGLAMLEPLAKSSYKVIIRPHPQSMTSEKETVEKLRQALGAYKNVEWNFDTENIKALSAADILISDFSGVIFDYAFLFNRPVVYPGFEFDRRSYDASDIEEEAWVFKAIREIGIVVEEKNFSDFEEFLDRAIEEVKSSGIIQKLRNEAYMYRGEAGKRTVDSLIQIMNRLSNEILE